MAASSSRGARSAAAPLALALAALTALTGCSSSHKTAATSSTPASTGTPTPTPTADAQAAQVLARAATTLAADRSYRFDATETVAAKTPVTTHLVGAVVRDNGVSYSLTVGRTTTQVVRVNAATYVRKGSGKWARLSKPPAVADPTASLAALLHGLTDATVASSGSTGTTVAGTLSAAAAKTAGIPTATEPVQVTVTVDPSGHVTRVTVHTSTQAGSTAVTVTLVTSYSGFDRVPALRRPV